MMNTNIKNVPVYQNSREEARRLDEIILWRESRNANIQCAKSIGEAISKHYNDNILGIQGAVDVIETYGHFRTQYVLASITQHFDYDGRFSRQNKEWAKDFFVPDRDEACDWLSDAHPCLLDGFVNQTRREFAKLNLYGKEHCLADSANLDFKNKVLILKPFRLTETYMHPEHQLFLDDLGGNWCNHVALGTKIFGKFLSDGEITSFNRKDFLGAIDPQFMPDWAAKKIQEMQNSNAHTTNIDITAEPKLTLDPGEF
jgi:hypothetical protein